MPLEGRHVQRGEPGFGVNGVGEEEKGAKEYPLLTLLGTVGAGPRYSSSVAPGQLCNRPVQRHM